MRLRRAALPILGLALMACATPIDRQRWLRARTEHFELVSSASPQTTKDIAAGLEQFRAATLHLLNMAEPSDPQPVLTYVFGDAPSYDRYRPREGVAGFMLPRPWRSYLVIDAARYESAMPIARHEYVHYLLHHHGSLVYPPWYDEGLAELLSTLHQQGDQIRVGEIPEERARWLVLGTPLSLRRVLLARQILRWPENRLSMFYAQAWALTHFFHSSHGVGLPRRLEPMVDYLRRVGKGDDPETAFETAFGAGIQEVERDYLTFIRNGNVPVFSFPASDARYREHVELESVERAESTYLLAELALASDRDALAEELLVASAALSPEDPRTLAALAWTKTRRQAADAPAALARAQSRASSDRDAAIWLGNAWLARAQLETSQAEALSALRSARRVFESVIARDPDDLAGLAGFGTSFVGETGDVGPGIEALKKAHRRLPDHPPILLALAELYAIRGDRELARELIEFSPAPGHAAQVDRVAIDRLIEKAGLKLAPPDQAFLAEPQLELIAPDAGSQLTSLVPLLEVKGHAGLGELLGHDIVIAIDESSSTLAASGGDVDGDATIGETTKGRRRPESYCTDPDDSIIQAELLAARTLVGQLDPEATRVAIVTFSGAARIRAPVGSREAALAALELYSVYFDQTGTSISAALETSVKAFTEAPASSDLRHRSIILLSDGLPTWPFPEFARLAALYVADQLGTYGIRVFAFGLGKEAVLDPQTYRKIAEKSGGAFVALENPADIVDHIARVRLSGLESIEVRNATGGSPGRAARVFADGSFDAYVDLVEGENTLEVVARLEGGSSLTERRTVRYTRPANPTPDDARAAAALTERLRVRTTEIELAERARRGTSERGPKAVTIEAEPSDDGSRR